MPLFRICLQRDILEIWIEKPKRLPAGSQGVGVAWWLLLLPVAATAASLFPHCISEQSYREALPNIICAPGELRKITDV